MYTVFAGSAGLFRSFRKIWLTVVIEINVLNISKLKKNINSYIHNEYFNASR